MPSLVHVFAYGSNMSTRRIAARVASAIPLATGFVTHRRLAFHKRGSDGSAKADAVYSGLESDRVWGVVFSISGDEKRILDDHELGYDEEQVVVNCDRRTLSANIYVARAETIHTSLRPFAWYHRFLIDGAEEHQLPADYVEHIRTFESISDPDSQRHHLNSRLLDGYGSAGK